MNFRQHKERLLKNPKVRKEHEKLGPEFQLAQSLNRARLKRDGPKRNSPGGLACNSPTLLASKVGNYDRGSLPTLKKVCPRARNRDRDQTLCVI